MDRTLSNRTFAALIGLYAVLAGLSVFLPNGLPPSKTPLPASLPVLALANAGIVLIVYGLLGFLGLVLSRRIDLPEMWAAGVTNRQRFLLPALIGVGVAAVLIVVDLLAAPYNGLGRFIHPPFPTSIVAALSAGIGEEIMFRLFFISFWTWLIGRLILRGRGLPVVYAVVSVLSALAFGFGHLPALMYLSGWTRIDQIPPLILAEILALNGLLALCAAYGFKKWGFLAAAGTHFWADVVWHVIWGLA
jgi:hypothetical protein